MSDSHDPAVLPGTRLDDYLVHRQLSSDMYGDEFVAEDLRSGQRVGLFVLSADLVRESPAFAPCLFETNRRVSELQHPGLLRILEPGAVSSGHAYVVREPSPGRSLWERLSGAGVLNPATALGIVAQVLEALDEIHRAGLRHGDLTPDTILLDPEDRVVLRDAGWIDAFASTASESGVVGTPFYMSPEGAQGYPTDGRSDLFALGTVLQVMLTGRHPFEDSATAVDILVNLIDNPYPDLPADQAPLQSLITRLSAKDPASRPATAREALALVDACASRLGLDPPIEDDAADDPPALPPETPSERSHQVFISHSQHNKAQADAICHCLESAGIRCWIAPRDVLPGESFPAAIMRGLKSTRFLVLIYSAHSNSSRHVLREVERAIALEHHIIPFRLDASDLSGDMEYMISSCHWLDAMTPPLETHITNLRDSILRQLGDA